MKKQTFLCFGLYLLLINTFSFSMQPCQENCNNVSNNQSASQRNFARQRAKGVIDCVPEVSTFINARVADDIMRRTAGQQNRNVPQIDLPSWNLLLWGPSGSGKTTLAKAIATYPGREYTIVSPASVNCDQQTQLLKDTIGPLFQQNEPSFVIIKNIDLFKRFHARNDKGDRFVCDANRLLCEYIEMAEEINNRRGRNRFAFLAITKKLDNVSDLVRELFKIIEVGLPDYPSRLKILTNLTTNRDGIDSKNCDEEFIEHVSQKTKGFSIRDLDMLANIAIQNALCDQRNNIQGCYLHQEHLMLALKEIFEQKISHSAKNHALIVVATTIMSEGIDYTKEWLQSERSRPAKEWLFSEGVKYVKNWLLSEGTNYTKERLLSEGIKYAKKQLLTEGADYIENWLLSSNAKALQDDKEPHTKVTG